MASSSSRALPSLGYRPALGLSKLRRRVRAPCTDPPLSSRRPASVHPSAAGMAAQGSSSSALLTIEPACRSRTLLFLSYRDSSSRPRRRLKPYYDDDDGSSYPPARYDRKGKQRARAGAGDEDRTGLLAHANGSNGYHETIDMDDTLPPKWMDHVDRVEEFLERAKPKMAQLDKLHARHLLPSFVDRSPEEREIEVLTSDITNDFRQAHAAIQRVTLLAKSMAADSSSSTDIVVIQNVRTALASKLQDVSSVFRKRQSNYLKQLKGYELRNQDLYAATGQNESASTQAAVDDDVKLSQNELQSQSLFMREEEQTAAIQQRDQEIANIARSITDLADLFKDLSSIVIDQGTMLDRIDYNVEQMAVDVKASVEELQTAMSYQRRSGKCRIIFLLVLLIVGAVIVLIYKPRRRGPPAAPP
ncbi:hypothetical protein E5Q_00828 [Mixia osmundae IAM 14324]|uniref:t-SNARE coiled-coil homology domain-containing protein n=1 Tax=Mixia osmundae (strain CBS 9802 / IAM 14324 / JCM 22182 / KY 12970) TaxID=764103 RepID=G7DUC0_MIXOS|nr:hypothetical protein E5Q_00828 [Mixia osmundae IAM 14324]